MPLIFRPKFKFFLTLSGIIASLFLAVAVADDNLPAPQNDPSKHSSAARSPQKKKGPPPATPKTTAQFCRVNMIEKELPTVTTNPQNLDQLNWKLLSQFAQTWQYLKDNAIKIVQNWQNTLSVRKDLGKYLAQALWDDPENSVGQLKEKINELLAYLADQYQHDNFKAYFDLAGDAAKASQITSENAPHALLQIIGYLIYHDPLLENFKLQTFWKGAVLAFLKQIATIPADRINDEAKAIIMLTMQGLMYNDAFKMADDLQVLRQLFQTWFPEGIELAKRVQYSTYDLFRDLVDLSIIRHTKNGPEDIDDFLFGQGNRWIESSSGTKEAVVIRPTLESIFETRLDVSTPRELNPFYRLGNPWAAASFVKHLNKDDFDNEYLYKIIENHPHPAAILGQETLYQEHHNLLIDNERFAKAVRQAINNVAQAEIWQEPYTDKDLAEELAPLATMYEGLARHANKVIRFPLHEIKLDDILQTEGAEEKAETNAPGKPKGKILHFTINLDEGARHTLPDYQEGIMALTKFIQQQLQKFHPPRATEKLELSEQDFSCVEILLEMLAKIGPALNTTNSAALFTYYEIIQDWQNFPQVALPLVRIYQAIYPVIKDNPSFAKISLFTNAFKAFEQLKARPIPAPAPAAEAVPRTAAEQISEESTELIRELQQEMNDIRKAPVSPKKSRATPNDDIVNKFKALVDEAMAVLQNSATTPPRFPSGQHITDTTIYEFAGEMISEYPGNQFTDDLINAYAVLLGKQGPAFTQLRTDEERLNVLCQFIANLINDKLKHDSQSVSINPIGTRENIVARYFKLFPPWATQGRAAQTFLLGQVEILGNVHGRIFYPSSLFLVPTKDRHLKRIRQSFAGRLNDFVNSPEAIKSIIQYWPQTTPVVPLATPRKHQHPAQASSHDLELAPGQAQILALAAQNLPKALLTLAQQENGPGSAAAKKLLDDYLNFVDLNLIYHNKDKKNLKKYGFHADGRRQYLGILQKFLTELTKRKNEEIPPATLQEIRSNLISDLQAYAKSFIDNDEGLLDHSAFAILQKNPAEILADQVLSYQFILQIQLCDYTVAPQEYARLLAYFLGVRDYDRYASYAAATVNTLIYQQYCLLRDKFLQNFNPQDPVHLRPNIIVSPKLLLGYMNSLDDQKTADPQIPEKKLLKKRLWQLLAANFREARDIVIESSDGDAVINFKRLPSTIPSSKFKKYFDPYEEFLYRHIRFN